MSSSSKFTLIALLFVSTLIVSLHSLSIEKKPHHKSHLKKANHHKLKDEPLDTSDSGASETESSDYEEVTDLRFLYQCIDQHNRYRGLGEGEVTDDQIVLYSSQIERIARRRAIKLAASGKLPSDSSTPKSLSADGIAENIAFTPVANNNATSAKFIDCRPIVDLWYSDAYGIERESIPIVTASAEEIKKSTISRKLASNQLRNLIWHQANEIGCAQVSTFYASNPGVYTVCNYRFTETSL